MNAYLSILPNSYFSLASVHCNTDTLYQPEAFAIASNLSLLTMYPPGGGGRPQERGGPQEAARRGGEEEKGRGAEKEGAEEERG